MDQFFFFIFWKWKHFNMNISKKIESLFIWFKNNFLFLKIKNYF